MGWRLDEWNSYYSDSSKVLPPMTKKEISKATNYLRNNNYPKPDDCPAENCSKYRPACKLEVCNIAVGMCGDF